MRLSANTMNIYSPKCKLDVIYLIVISNSLAFVNVPLRKDRSPLNVIIQAFKKHTSHSSDLNYA